MPKKPTNNDELMANMGLCRNRKQRRIAEKLYNYKPQDIQHEQNTNVPNRQEEIQHKPERAENNDVSGVHGDLPDIA